MRTVDQIAQALGVDRMVAYGLLSSMAKMGLVATAKAPREGKKGRAAVLYRFDADAVTALAKRLSEATALFSAVDTTAARVEALDAAGNG